MELFGSSGVRGVVGEFVTPPFVARIATAATATVEAERVAIGRDTRVHGDLFADAASSGVAAAGAAVDRLGVLPTPAVAAYADREGVPALVLTASHNPPEYSGIKLLDADGVECGVDVLDAIEAAYARLVDEPAHVDRSDDRSDADVGTGDGAGDGMGHAGIGEEYAAWDATGRIEHVDGAAAEYRDAILAAVDSDAIAAADLTVAVDPGHGAGCTVTPALFRELGCQVVTVNAAPDGRFPNRASEPTPETLTDLGRLVRSADADLGVAHDGDADRAIFCDETGEVIPGASSFAAVAAATVEDGDVVVSAANASQRLVDAVDDAGGTLDLVRIGSTYIVARVREHQAGGERVPIAGEGNGGVLFPSYRPVPDGAYLAARFAGLVARRPASEVVGPFADYESVRHNVGYETAPEREAMLDAVEAVAAEADADITTIDGYRLDRETGWLMARPSGTEPVVRIIAESSDAEQAGTWAEDLRERLVDARDTC
jgi:phosphomannomutase/phosphoglucomutase